MESKFITVNSVVKVNGKYFAVENQYLSYSGKWGERISKAHFMLFIYFLRKILK